MSPLYIDMVPIYTDILFLRGGLKCATRKPQTHMQMGRGGGAGEGEGEGERLP